MGIRKTFLNSRNALKSWYPSIACFVKDGDPLAFFNTEKEAVDYVNHFYGEVVCNDLYSAQSYVENNAHVGEAIVEFFIRKYHGFQR